MRHDCKCSAITARLQKTAKVLSRTSVVTMRGNSPLLIFSVMSECGVLLLGHLTSFQEFFNLAKISQRMASCWQSTTILSTWI